MAGVKTAPFGSWKSPITADVIVESTVRLGKVCLDGDDVYWLETRPEQAGRDMVVCSLSGGLAQDVTPVPFNARTRVHEFGGGAFSVQDGKVYFSNAVDQRIYRQIKRSDGTFSDPEPLTPEPQSSGRHLRFADIACDPGRQRLICVQEDHSQHGAEPVNSLVSVWLDGERSIETLACGFDFYSFPRVSPDGSKLAWLCWKHPDMPWDAAELWVASIKPDGSLSDQEHIAGGGHEAIFQPEWASDGTLHFVCDRTGWWNIYRLGEQGRIEPLCKMSAEFGMPQWYFGQATYGFASAESIFCAFCRQGIWHLGELNTSTGQFIPVDIPFQEITSLRVNNHCLVFRGGSPVEPIAVVQVDIADGSWKILRSSLLSERARGMEQVADSCPLSARLERAQEAAFLRDALQGYLSEPEAIEFPTGGALSAHAFYYKPQNKDFSAPAGLAPPALVRVHGGPNNATTSTLDLMVQYWTSRGFAVLDVNYGGSSGFGRAYRERLKGKWGVLEVEDCVNGALYLVGKGLADAKRLAICGGSAGGYATINAVTFHDVFSSGAAQFGVSDMEAMAGYFHKFEARYLESMIGPWPERRDLYVACSAINFVERIGCPLILLHGLDDTIVPPDQSERLAERLRACSKPFAYLPFAGEPHVFRKDRNVKRALEAELYFHCQALGLTPADQLEPVGIENRDKLKPQAVPAT